MQPFAVHLSYPSCSADGLSWSAESRQQLFCSLMNGHRHRRTYVAAARARCAVPEWDDEVWAVLTLLGVPVMYSIFFRIHRPAKVGAGSGETPQASQNDLQE